MRFSVQLVGGFVVAHLLFASSGALAQAWEGVWDSRWRDGGATLYLTQDEDMVTGTYPALNGNIRGEVRGQLLVGSWDDDSGSGRFTFAIAPDRQSFSGRFGTGEWWTAQRVDLERTDDRVRADVSSPRTALSSFITAGNAARDNRMDRLAPAVSVLDFSELPPQASADAVQRLELAVQLFRILDLLTFRVWEVPVPRSGEREVAAVLDQAGTEESFRVRFRYGIRANGAAGWFIVVPDPTVMTEALDRLLVAHGGQLPHQRAHEELRSPRDTMRTFLEQYGIWQRTGEHALLFRTLTLDGFSESGRQDEAALAAQYLKQVIDRVGYVIWQEIPNFGGQEGAYTHFVHPAGRIDIAPFESEAFGRIWRFTAETMNSARPLYVALEDMPLDAGVNLDSSSFFLQLRDSIRAFDRDLLGMVGGVELWQWIALAAVLVVGFALSWLLTALLFRLVLRMKREPGELMSIRARFMWPLQILIVGGLILVALRILGLPETVDVPVRIIAGVALAIAGGWFLYHLVDKLGVLAWEASGRLRYRDEMLRSLMVALAKVAVIIGALLFLAEVLSIPYQGVLAGLGIGGLAVALAARSTLENFIGGLTLLADKPIQLGDFCKFGDQIGTIEGIGLRSVKIRSLDRTVVTVPNGEFVNLYLENYTRRDRILLKTILQLRYETTPDQLRWVLTELRKMMLQHPKVLADPSRARFVGFGAHSLDVEIFAYVETADWNEYLSIQEDIYLRMIDIVERSGTGFAFPSMVNYLARDPGIDDEGRARAEEAVAQLRDKDRLPFPDFDADEQWGMFNQGAYPPPGSPHSARAAHRRQAAAQPPRQEAFNQPT